MLWGREQILQGKHACPTGSRCSTCPQWHPLPDTLRAEGHEWSHTCSSSCWRDPGIMCISCGMSFGVPRCCFQQARSEDLFCAKHQGGYRQITLLPFTGLRIQTLPLKAPASPETLFSGTISFPENGKMDPCAAFLSEEGFPAPPSAGSSVQEGVGAVKPSPLSHPAFPVLAASILWGL